MKCLVYTKNGNRKVAIIENVTSVYYSSKTEITFVTKNNETFIFDTKIFKTTSYQN